nr:unnamed protein product [Callosobruchus chinensis]
MFRMSQDFQTFIEGCAKKEVLIKKIT